MCHKVNPTYLKRGLRFLKNHRRVDQEFLVKGGEGGGGGGGGVIHIGQGCLQKG